VSQAKRGSTSGLFISHKSDRMSFMMKDWQGSVQLVLLFLMVAAIIVFIFLLSPDTFRLPYPKEIFPK